MLDFISAQPQTLRRILLALVDSVAIIVSIWAAFAIRLGDWWPVRLQNALELFPLVPRWELKYRRLPSGENAGPQISDLLWPTSCMSGKGFPFASSPTICRSPPSSATINSPPGVTVILSTPVKIGFLLVLASYITLIFSVFVSYDQTLLSNLVVNDTIP